MAVVMDINGKAVSVNGPEMNGAVIDRIANLVHYGMTVEEIVATIPETPATPARWVRFMANGIANGTYFVKD